MVIEDKPKKMFDKKCYDTLLGYKHDTLLETNISKSGPNIDFKGYFFWVHFLVLSLSTIPNFKSLPLTKA